MPTLFLMVFMIYFIYRGKMVQKSIVFVCIDDALDIIFAYNVILQLVFFAFVSDFVEQQQQQL